VSRNRRLIQERLGAARFFFAATRFDVFALLRGLRGDDFGKGNPGNQAGARIARRLARESEANQEES